MEWLVPLSGKVIAVAQVRGIAAPQESQRWLVAREALRDELTAKRSTEGALVEALPGAGWDFMVGADELAFVSAVPAGPIQERRRAELHAARHVGAQYHVVVVPSS